MWGGGGEGWNEPFCATLIPFRAGRFMAGAAPIAESKIRVTGIELCAPCGGFQGPSDHFGRQKPAQLFIVTEKS